MDIPEPFIHTNIIQGIPNIFLRGHFAHRCAVTALVSYLKDFARTGEDIFLATLMLFHVSLELAVHQQEGVLIDLFDNHATP